MKREPAVTDSTCLIGLERIGRLDLLPSLFDPIAAPPKVIEEFGSSPSWLQVLSPTNRQAVFALQLTVDLGEAEAIALALERNWRIILDDRKARLVARRLGLKVIGTVGVLLRAKRKGIVSRIAPLLQDLEAAGFYLSEALKREALRLAGEG